MIRHLSCITILAASASAQIGWQLTRANVVSLPVDAVNVVPVADQDADKLPDFVYRRSSDPRRLDFSFGRGTLQFASRVADFDWRDWNGDGAMDLAVGLPEHKTAKGIVGAARVYDGRDLRSSASPRVLFESLGEQDGVQHGRSVTILIANSDEQPDLLVARATNSVALDGKSGQALWTRPESWDWVNVGDIDFDQSEDVFARAVVHSGANGQPRRVFPDTRTWAVGDVTGDRVQEFVTFDRSTSGTDTYRIWSGRGVRALGEWSCASTDAPSFHAFDERAVTMRIGDRTLTLLDPNLSEVTQLVQLSTSRIEGAFPWVDLDEDGIAEALTLKAKDGKLRGDAYSQHPYTLYADRLEVRASTGGTQDLTFNPRFDVSGKWCLVLGSLSGRWPSTWLNGRAVPLVFDAYTDLLLAAPNSFLAPSSYVFGGARTQVSRLSIPALPSLKGLRLDHAVVVFGHIDPPSPPFAVFVSNAVPLHLR